MNFEIQTLFTDILIIGGGTAGCFAALTIAEKSESKVIIAEKANIKRSGCLASGVNAINAYIPNGESPDSYLEYVKSDAEGIIREDLVYTIAKRLNSVVQKIEKLGLTILKDQNGDYVKRGRWNIKINGENIKPILASAVLKNKNIKVINKINIIDYIVKNGEVIGAYGFSLTEYTFYVIYAKAVICTTGGASGIYKSKNASFSQHKTWYPPFNAGAGYAMGIRAGAEMTTFEMRFIALRCKDTIAPTGTLSLGVGAKQINSKGEEYDNKYGIPKTSIRVFSTICENNKGNGPCYLKTKGISKDEEYELYKAYLNMAPSQTLKWIDKGVGPSEEDVEIEGTEPYIVGGHTASGYWVDTKRATTIKGLYAAGDVVGGSPQKFVSGCLAEGEIAAISALEYIENKDFETIDDNFIFKKLEEVNRFFINKNCLYSIFDVEEAMQRIMDEYAGGISTSYVISENKLNIASKFIDELFEVSKNLKANDLHELMLIFELIDRLYICKVLIEHLKVRKETRWPGFNYYIDYPQKDDKEFLKFVNSKFENNKVNIIFRDLVKKDEIYEHKD